MKLDYCYYCDGFVSTHKKYIMWGFLTFKIKRVCNTCGNKTYKRKRTPKSKEDKN